MFFSRLPSQLSFHCRCSLLALAKRVSKFAPVTVRSLPKTLFAPCPVSLPIDQLISSRWPEVAFEEENHSSYPHLFSVRFVRLIETFDSKERTNSKERAKLFQSGLPGIASTASWDDPASNTTQTIMKNIAWTCKGLWISPVERIRCNF